MGNIFSLPNILYTIFLLNFLKLFYFTLFIIILSIIIIYTYIIHMLYRHFFLSHLDTSHFTYAPSFPICPLSSCCCYPCPPSLSSALSGQKINCSNFSLLLFHSFHFLLFLFKHTCFAPSHSHPTPHPPKPEWSFSH